MGTCCSTMTSLQAPRESKAYDFVFMLLFFFSFFNASLFLTLNPSHLQNEQSLVKFSRQVSEKRESCVREKTEIKMKRKLEHDSNTQILKVSIELTVADNGKSTLFARIH